MDSIALSGLEITSSTENNWFELPKCYSQPKLPVSRDEIATAEKVHQWNYLQDISELLPKSSDVDVGLLIGANCPKALEPMVIRSSQNGGPYAFKSRLGWCIVGPLGQTQSFNTNCNRAFIQNHNFSKCFRTKVKEVEIGEMLKKMYTSDFIEPPMKCYQPHVSAEIDEYSVDDTNFMKLMDKEIKKEGEHYILPLPLKEPKPNLPNNKSQAFQRLYQLKKKMKNNNKFYLDYRQFMAEMLEKGYASVVNKERQATEKVQSWYIPHFGVYDPNKPDKIRIVFDCSAEFKGKSLNKELMSGPDLTNQLLGVLLRFRQHNIAIMADIEKMFFQVRVPESQRHLLRFLWWPQEALLNDDATLLDQFEPVLHEVNVHLFGAVSSPSCSRYALKRSALDYSDINREDEAITTVSKNFYVDDLLKSVETVEEAIEIIRKVTDICKSGGFNLTKFTSNRREVLQSIPNEKLRKNLKEIKWGDELLPEEKSLGTFWNMNEDRFEFRVKKTEKPATRRGMLSFLSSIYDPCGFVAPFILRGRRIIQEICRTGCDWDEPVDEQIQTNWSEWKENLSCLANIFVERCFKPLGFGKVTDVSVHHFSDASAIGYGQVSYIRQENNQDGVHCNILIGKSRVAPLKNVSTPRLELTAAVLSVKMSILIRKELNTSFNEVFWTDSQVVLSYIRNRSKRFKIFVANRIQFILEHTSPSQWHYIPTKLNPADASSRGLTGRQQAAETWFKGPKFLWKSQRNWPRDVETQIEEGDPEVCIRQIVLTTKVVWKDVVTCLEERVSSWMRMKRIMAYVLRIFRKDSSQSRILRSQTKQIRAITVTEMEKAGMELLKLMQATYFSDDKERLERGKNPSKVLLDLNPFVGRDGLIQVGGRLKNSSFTEELIHPILLPKSPISRCIIRWCHLKVGHGGRDATLNELRMSGYWMQAANSEVRALIYKCTTCRALRGKIGQQIMSQLPADRFEESPFTNNGVDMFGPFVVKRGRSEIKRYGALFTCFSSRAVHIEVTETLSTDSFILALRRFMARRGMIRSVRSDNETNFVRCKGELNKAFQEMNHQKIGEVIAEKGADWFYWKNNPPAASHHGGIWERQIRSARTILDALMKSHPGILTDESLTTLMQEAEAIINSRPLAVENISDVNSFQAITPSMFLTQKTKMVSPPPGHFSTPDLYCRRQWRRVQHLAEEFWVRWRKEFVLTLQQRKKWNQRKRDLQINDIVLIKEDQGRMQWPLGKVIQMFPDKDGRVRSVKLKVPRHQEDLVRPISKLVLLMEAIPDEEPGLSQGGTTP